MVSYARASLITRFGGAFVLAPLVSLAPAACSDAAHPPPLAGSDSGVHDGLPEGGAAEGAASDSASKVPSDGAPADVATPDRTMADVAAADVATTDDGSADDGSASESAAPGDASGLCNMLVPDGPLVSQTVLGGSQPAAMGGHIFAGTYWLTERDTYGGVPDGLFVQRSLVLNDTTINVVGGDTTSDAGAPVLQTTTSSYQVYNMVVFSTDESCPGPPHLTNVLFTSVGGQLTLYPTTDTAEVYTLQ